jgi:hypothetical protein
VGIICAPTLGVEQQHAFDKPFIDRLIPGSETGGALKVILAVQAMLRTLKYLLKGYPGFEAMKAVGILFEDLITGVNYKPPPVVILRGHQSQEKP